MRPSLDIAPATLAFENPLQDISLDDLQRLVTNAVSESRSIEYKQALPGTTNDDKKEFLADVSAFANAVGGDLLYGTDLPGDVRTNRGLTESRSERTGCLGPLRR